MIPEMHVKVAFQPLARARVSASSGMQAVQAASQAMQGQDTVGYGSLGYGSSVLVSTTVSLLA